MVEVSKDGLLPCPFCGGEAERYTAMLFPGFEDRQVQCRSCGATAFDLKWQERTPSTLQAERDRYRVALEAIVNGNPTIDSPEGHASWDFIIARTALSDAPVQS